MNNYELESLVTGVFELTGEPAIIINGVPTLPSTDLVPIEVISNAELTIVTEFGEWLEGRGVRKIFEGKFYDGKVTMYDKENCWYRVLYEDNDFEDSDWHELEKVLLPLDVNVSLRTLGGENCGQQVLNRWRL
ncbi:dirigent protein 17-like [Impatiens glandulifera]|uniref:dirigent protein 17-like n=1 Tax=Impatiens glandulifera TaxID=253017 RepID=UPI001FB123DA|nr:dirigent protein 17-like [Impatiens glandulifera]